MDAALPTPRPLKARRGFTITELMIVMVIAAVLATVAYPTYQSAIRKSRRSEAMTALSQIQLAEERHRSQQPAFTTLLTALPTDSPPGLGLPSTRTEKGYYDLSVALVTATTTYVATATAVTGTSQADDGTCAVLSARVQGGNVRYGAGASIDWSSSNTDPNRCWAR